MGSWRRGKGLRVRAGRVEGRSEKGRGAQGCKTEYGDEDDQEAPPPAAEAAPA